jgi:predicted aspartyl protease
MALERLVVVLLLAAVVAACDGSGGRSATGTVDARTCKVERRAELPVRLVLGHIVVPASINNHPVELAVDTGASSSMLTVEAAERLGLPPDPHRSTTVHGIGGTITTRNVLARSFIVGGEDRMASSITTGHLSALDQADSSISGLLGADYLQFSDVELDLPHGRMVLWNVHDCASDFLGWHVPHFVLPLYRYQPNRLVAYVRVDGQKVTALIDWGARATTLTTAAATALGVTPEALSHDRSGTSHGVDQNEVPIRIHRFEQLSIGPATFRNIALEVADLHVSDVGMLLGVDYFRTRHVWLSYATEQMFVEQHPVPVPISAR